MYSAVITYHVETIHICPNEWFHHEHLLEIHVSQCRPILWSCLLFITTRCKAWIWGIFGSIWRRRYRRALTLFKQRHWPVSWVLFRDYSINPHPHPHSRPKHDDVIKWKDFPRYWPFVRGIHRSPVNSPHKSQWRGALMFVLICAWINNWLNNRDAGELRQHRAHYDVIVMQAWFWTKNTPFSTEIADFEVQ